MAAEDNLFVCLHKWAWRQDENFHTEALAFLLRHLLMHEPDTAVHVLARLAGEKVRLAPPEAGRVVITTQVTTAEGRPDLRIRAPGRLVFVEAKVEADLGDGQLDRYRSVLTKAEKGDGLLVLLTRYPVELGDGEVKPDVQVLWYELASCLREKPPKGEVGKYLLEQFLAFLRPRGMAMEQVGRELGAGIQALRNLMAMLDQAVKRHSYVATYYVNKTDNGYWLDGKNFWVGVNYDEPEVYLGFYTHAPININAAYQAEQEGCGRVLRDAAWASDVGGVVWTRWLPLGPEEGFFSKTEVEQLKCLEEFLAACLRVGKAILQPGEPGPLFRLKETFQQP